MGLIQNTFAFGIGFNLSNGGATAINSTIGSFVLGRLYFKPPWPSAVVWVPALVVSAAVLLPPVYLIIRAASDGSSAVDAIFRLRILEIMGRTLLLVGAVSTGSVILAVPLAWLTVRTDLPFRRIWAVLTALPLVIPSYVGGFIVVVNNFPGAFGDNQNLVSGVLVELVAGASVEFDDSEVKIAAVASVQDGLTPNLRPSHQSAGHFGLGYRHIFHSDFFHLSSPII